MKLRSLAWFWLGLACLVAVAPDASANRLRLDFFNAWAASECVKGHDDASGRAPVHVRIHHVSGNTHRIETGTICSASSPAVWIDGRGPHRNGARLELDPGWHEVYAEAAGGRGTAAVLHTLQYVPSVVPDMECQLRDFWLVGEETNAILVAPPTFEWSAAGNDPGCRRTDCVKECAPLPDGARLQYRLILDGNLRHLPGSPTSAVPVVPDDCGGRWEVPAGVWEALPFGFHQLTLQAELRVGDAVKAVKDVRYGFYKAVDPARLGPAAGWDPAMETAYKLAGGIYCQGGCRPGTFAMTLGGDPERPRGDSLVNTLESVAGNFALHNRSERTLYTEISRFAPRLEGPFSQGTLEPRFLPADLAARGGRTVPVYRDLLADVRGRPVQGQCKWARDMHGIAVCPGQAVLPDAHVVWKGQRGGYVQAVVSHGPAFSRREETYVAQLVVKTPPGGPVRIRAGWNSRAPQVLDLASGQPLHRSVGLRLEAGTTSRHLLKLRLAPPPAPPYAGRGGASPSSPLMGKPKALWFLVISDYGVAEVESIRIYRVREGFLARLTRARNGDPVGLYFDDFDRFPSPVRTETKLLSPAELADLQATAGWGEVRIGSFHRWADSEDRDHPIVFRKSSPFAHGGPHAGPRPDQVLYDPALETPLRGFEEVRLAKNQDRPESAAFFVMEGRAGPQGAARRRFPGRGSVTLSPGGSRQGPGGLTLDYEIWTSLAYLTQGPGWAWKDANDSPVVTNLLLTKGGRPWFAAHNSRLRVDEGMDVLVETGARSTVKLLVNLFPRGDLAPGVYEGTIDAGTVKLPLRVRVADAELAPERNNWIQIQTTTLWGGKTPDEEGCDFDQPGWGSYKGQDGCQWDKLGWEDHVWLCRDDFHYLARRVREHSLLGAYIGAECRRAGNCPGMQCREDPVLPFRTGRCNDTNFNDLVARIKRAWNEVEPLPRATYTRDDLLNPPYRPWISTNLYPGYAAWPACDSGPDGHPDCPLDRGGKLRLRDFPGARVFGAIRTAQEAGLGAMPFFAHMDAIYSGGPERAAGFAVLIDSYHNYGAGSVVTMFPPDKEQTFADMIDKAAVATGPPRAPCMDECGVDGRPVDVHDLERQLRWTQFYGNSWNDRGALQDICPRKSPRTGLFWTWGNYMRELFRQRQLHDRESGNADCSRCPGRTSDCYCCGYPAGGSAGECDPRDSYDAPYGACPPESRLACRFSPEESRTWCPRFAEGPGPGREGEHNLDMVVYSIGWNWFLALQEECTPGEPCRYNKPWRQEQAMWPEIDWKLPFNARLSGGFWTGASNLDGFHPFHLVRKADHAAQVDMFSNFAGWLRNPVGFIYKAESRPDTEGEGCEGSCSGVAMTESWEALRAGYTDIRWWDALVALEPRDPACRARRARIIEQTRSMVFPYGVGRSKGPGQTGPVGLPYGNNYWVMPGYPAEVLGDSDLERMKREIIATLEECGGRP